jgi:hypothetical protein
LHPAPKIVWIVHCGGAWGHSRPGVVVVLTSPSRVKYKYPACWSFTLDSKSYTNNIVEHKTIILDLQKLRALRVKTCIIK